MSQPKHLEESYSDRRKMFRNIFKNAFALEDAAMDGNPSRKPRIIKTMRVEERTSKSTERKQILRLRNLRSVCNKILDSYCDHPEVYDANHVPKTPIGHRRCKHFTRQKKKLVKKNRAHPGPPVQNNSFLCLCSPNSSPSPSPSRHRIRKTTVKNSRTPRQVTTSNQAAPAPKETSTVRTMSVKRNTKPKRSSGTLRKLAKKKLE